MKDTSVDNTSKTILIISDGKPGHLNQSIAFAVLKNITYDVVTVSYRNRFLKLISYLFDYLGIYTKYLFSAIHPQAKNYTAIVATGSTTYYPAQYIARKFNTKSVVIMLPKGYVLNHFDFIVAQEHDHPPQRPNIISTAVNLSINSPSGHVTHDGHSKYVGIVIGGSNSVFNMPYNTIKSELDAIFNEFPSHKKLITTSPRTSLEIEKLCREYEFDYQLIYSDHPDINPIPDFVEICDELFITSDSTSMISEAAANSDANIHIIMLDSDRKDTKFHKLIDIVENLDGKIDLTSQLKDIDL